MFERMRTTFCGVDEAFLREYEKEEVGLDKALEAYDSGEEAEGDDDDGEIEESEEELLSEASEEGEDENVI